MKKKNSLKNILNLSIFILLVLEIFYLYKINTDYKGVYQIQYFIPCVIILVVIFIRSIVEEKTLRKNKKIVLLCILVLIPLIIYFTLPNYSYNEGKDIIRKELKSTNLEFSKSQEEYTVPIINNSRFSFVKDKEYYYIINSDSETKYFKVNPVTGSLDALSSNFW